MEKPKDIQLERRGKWYTLRQNVCNQYYGMWQEYAIKDGEVQAAINAVRKVARKYGFYVSVTADRKSIVVYKDRKND